MTAQNRAVIVVKQIVLWSPSVMPFVPRIITEPQSVGIFVKPCIKSIVWFSQCSWGVIWHHLEWKALLTTTGSSHLTWTHRCCWKQPWKVCLCSLVTADIYKWKFQYLEKFYFFWNLINDPSAFIAHMILSLTIFFFFFFQTQVQWIWRRYPISSLISP